MNVLDYDTFDFKLGSSSADEWRDEVACRDVDPAIFDEFRDRGGRNPIVREEMRQVHYDRARAICAPCPVQQECLADWLAHARADAGMFVAGYTPDELFEMVVERRGHDEGAA